MARVPAKLLSSMSIYNRRMLAAFVKAITDLKSDTQIRVLEDAIRANDITAVYAALNLSPVVFAPLEAAIRETFLAGGDFTLDSVRKLPDPTGPGRMVLRFDGRQERAEEWVRTQSSNLITEIVDDTKEAVRVVVLDGLERGRGPRATSLDLIGRVNPVTGKRTGGIIGLTSSQAQAVLRARAELLSGDPSLLKDYLKRARRDKRFDSAIRRALSGKAPLTAAEVRRITDRYKDRLLAYRGEVIARTESLSALNAGREEGIRQLIDSGKVRADQVKKTWRATGDDRTRDTHKLLNGVTLGINEPFITAEGHRLMYPHDKSLQAPGSEVIQCRCYYELKVNYL